MYKRKEKRIRDLRGRRNAGYGDGAGHRASGQRGGQGMAGSEKGDRIRTMKLDPHYFGKHGFKRPEGIVSPVKTINVGDLDEAVDRLVARGLATKSGTAYTIDMGRLGVDKVLGSGKVAHKLNLTGVKVITSGAREKLTSVGGSVDLPEE
ncbi:MAG: 50S ribosomal protein L15 [Candidatus Thorarchaeota archaeon]|nr:MAG: 50S ribosomal protein L15 [Candidatus Thorarchaeota archaeon]